MFWVSFFRYTELRIKCKNNLIYFQTYTLAFRGNMTYGVFKVLVWNWPQKSVSPPVYVYRVGRGIWRLHLREGTTNATGSGYVPLFPLLQQAPDTRTFIHFIQAIWLVTHSLLFASSDHAHNLTDVWAVTMTRARGKFPKDRYSTTRVWWSCHMTFWLILRYFLSLYSKDLWAINLYVGPTGISNFNQMSITK